jgi:hypothetical protein
LTHGVSETKGAPAHGGETDYIHNLFDAELRHSAKLQSDRALAWITPEEIQYLWTAAARGEPGAPQGPAGRVSRTAYEILVHLGLIAEAGDPADNAEIEKYFKRLLSAFGGSDG